ncbi:MAG: winged helix-turn-helix domain-containing protein [Bacteroidales bacterium]|nr:winged helix-turn-helix domain-containing protein [Bacteroidales bacterium]
MALGAKKYRLLGFMMVHFDQVFTRERLLHDVWDKDFDTSTNVVVYVRYL